MTRGSSGQADHPIPKLDDADVDGSCEACFCPPPPSLSLSPGLPVPSLPRHTACPTHVASSSMYLRNTQRPPPSSNSGRIACPSSLCRLAPPMGGPAGPGRVGGRYTLRGRESLLPLKLRQPITTSCLHGGSLTAVSHPACLFLLAGRSRVYRPTRFGLASSSLGPCEHISVCLFVFGFPSFSPSLPSCVSEPLEYTASYLHYTFELIHHYINRFSIIYLQQSSKQPSTTHPS